MRNSLSKLRSGLYEAKRRAEHLTQPLYALGQAQAASGRLDAAIASFREVLAADALHFPARIALATVLSANGDHSGALTEIETVLVQEPDNLQALGVKGNLEAALGRIEAAILSFQKIVAERPNATDGRVALASLFSTKGDQARAIAEFSEVLRIDPTNLAARKTKGKIEAAMGRFADAICTFEQYVDVVRDDSEAWQALGDCYLSNDCDGFIKAEQAYRNALAHRPGGGVAFRGLGECLARRKRLDEAQAAHDAWFEKWMESAESDGLRTRQDAARARGVPAIMFVAMLKSASEFIRENLIRALDIPLIDVNIGTVPRDRCLPSAVRQLAKGGAISRAHASGNTLKDLADNGLRRLIVHVRDPRQVTISWLHMMRRLSNAELRYAAYMYDPPVPNAFPGWEWQRQLDWAVENFLPGQIEWLEGWVAALDAATEIRVKVSRFEDFRVDQNSFFRELFDFYGIERGLLPSFPEQSVPAMRNFRQGEIDEWRSVLAPARLARCDPRLKPLTERFGWEH